MKFVLAFGSFSKLRCVQQDNALYEMRIYYNTYISAGQLDMALMADVDERIHLQMRAIR